MLTPKELKATFQTLKSVSISLFYLFWHPPSDTVHRGDSELLSICGGRAVLERVWSVMVELAFKNHSLFQSLTSTGWKLCSPLCCLPSCDPSFCLSPSQGTAPEMLHPFVCTLSPSPSWNPWASPALALTPSSLASLQGSTDTFPCLTSVQLL